MLADAAAVQPDRGPRRAKAVVALQVAVVAAVAQRRVVDAAVDIADVGRAGAAAIEVDGDGQRRVLLHGRARDADELVVVAVAARVAPRRRRVGRTCSLPRYGRAALTGTSCACHAGGGEQSRPMSSEWLQKLAMLSVTCSSGRYGVGELQSMSPTTML